MRAVRVVAFASLVLFTSCVSVTVGPRTVAHQSFRYVAAAPAGDPHWAGDQLEATWKAEPLALVTDVSPVNVELRAELRGPFASVEALKAVMSAPSPSAPLASPIGDMRNPCVMSTDTWKGVDVTCGMRAPAVAGFYDLAMATAVGPAGQQQDITTSHSVLHVVVP